MDKQDVCVAIDKVYAKYSADIRINEPALLQLTFHNLKDCHPAMSNEIKDLILATIRDEIGFGNLSMSYGRMGGISQIRSGVIPAHEENNMSWIDSQDIIHAIDKVYSEYAEGVRMNRSALVNFVFYRIDPKGILTSNMEALINHTIKSEIDAGNLVMTIGKNGGISKPIHAQTGAGDSKSSVVANDHICPSCGNDRVSRCEKSCWKCGGSL